MKQRKTRFTSLMKYTNDILTHSFSRFLLGGGLNTAFTYVIYVLLLVAVHHQIAYISAYVCGVIVVSYINPKYVYRVESSALNGIKTALTYCLQYLLGALLLETLVRFVGISPFIAPLIVICALVPVTFGINYILLKKDIARMSVR